MNEITIDGKTYKELKIKNLIIGSKVTEGFIITSDKLNGETNLNIDIQAERPSTPTDSSAVVAETTSEVSPEETTN